MQVQGCKQHTDTETEKILILQKKVLPAVVSEVENSSATLKIDINYLFCMLIATSIGWLYPHIVYVRIK